MKMPHDVGGDPAGPVDTSEHASAFWEQRVDAIRMLTGRAARGEPLIRTDEMRRTVEQLGAEAYEKLSYYERWISSIASLLIEKGVLHIDEIGRKLTEIERREDEAESA